MANINCNNKRLKGSFEFSQILNKLEIFTQINRNIRCEKVSKYEVQ